VLWLEQAEFLSHLARLKDDEIKSSYTLPPKGVLYDPTSSYRERRF
jgi:hypothetical protein